MIKRVLGFIAALALLYGAAWLGAAFWLRAELQRFAADLTSKGYAIERGEPVFIGFPLTVGVAIPDLTVAAPPAAGGWRWQSGGVRVNLHAGAPTEPVIDLTGSHRVTGFLSAPNEGLSLNVGRGLASLALARDGSLENIVLKLSETTIAGAADDAPILSLKDGALHIALDTGHVTWRVRDMTLAEPVPVLSETITSLDLTLDIVAPLPSGALREALNAWREGGGAIEVRSIALDWPPARAAGSGTIALDAALQPIGAATIKFQGFFDIVSALVAKGHVDRSVESMAKVVLGMLAKPSATGEPELSLPLTVQDRILSAGPVKLMEMPEVIWDANARVP